MRRVQIGLGMALAIFMVLVVPGLALAQEADAQEGFTDDFVADLERVGGRLAQLAEAVPADKYGWAPSDDVRTVSAVYVHVIFVNNFLPVALGAAPAEGLEMPEDMNPMALMQKWEAEMTDKEVVVVKLKESFEYAAAAVRTISDHETVVETFGFPGSKRAYLLILLTHAHEHLGQSIAYARSLGVVPPWSQPAAGEGN